ncbi:MAG: hypothetical protein GYA14_07415, partial [Ignavibacteria bacterium]|nr:hypothetical protein [Ignavibacteria bacterium]
SMHEINFNEIFSQNKIDYRKLREYATNDFEQIVFIKYPEIEKIKNEFYRNGALYASMSGSGSTVFGIFGNEEEANKSIINLPKNYFYWISTPHH